MTEEKDKEINCDKIDVISPIKLFLNKENWKNSLLIWLIIFLIIEIINYHLEAIKQLGLFRLVNLFNMILIFGYIGVYLHYVINNKKEILPSLNLKTILITAFNLYIILVPPKLLVALLIYFISPICLSLIKTSNLLNLAFFAIIIVGFITIDIFAIFAECAYLKDFQLSEGFKYLKIWKLFKIGWADIIKTYFQAFLIMTPMICFYFLLYWGHKSFNIIYNIQFVFLLGILCKFIFSIIKMNLIGQVYKNTLCQVENSLVTNAKLFNKKKFTILVSLLIIIFIIVLMLTNSIFNFHSDFLTMFFKCLKTYTYNYLFGV